jgi:hypothetical protein
VFLGRQRSERERREQPVDAARADELGLGRRPRGDGGAGLEPARDRERAVRALDRIGAELGAAAGEVDGARERAGRIEAGDVRIAAAARLERDLGGLCPSATNRATNPSAAPALSRVTASSSPVANTVDP